MMTWAECGNEIAKLSPENAMAIQQLHYLESIGKGINPLDLPRDRLCEYADFEWISDYERAFKTL